jgi:chemotaxis signal transduction protein
MDNNAFLREPLTSADMLALRNTRDEVAATPHTSGNLLLVVKIAGSLFALRALDVEGVLPPMAPRSVPIVSAPHLLGFINHRGVAIPVLDLAGLRRLPRTDKPAARFLVVRSGALLTALPCHEVLGVSEQAPSPAPHGTSPITTVFGLATELSAETLSHSLGGLQR